MKLSDNKSAPQFLSTILDPKELKEGDQWNCGLSDVAAVKPKEAEHT